MEKINFLPTKFKYNSYNNTIEMYYRQKNSNKLFQSKIPFDHYIYISNSYRTYGNTDKIYKLLSTNEKMVKLYINPNDAYDLYDSRWATGEADITAEQRFICDSFADVEYPSDIKPRIFYLDIETYVTDDKFPTFQHNISEISAISLYDSYTKEFYTWALIPDTYKDKNDINNLYKEIKEITAEYGNINLNLFNSPKSLLTNFIDFIQIEIPDIITAWNSSFDIPYIVRKVYDYFELEGLKKLSPFNRISSKVKKALENDIDLKLDTIIPGIDVIDMLSLYKKYSDTEKSSYSLDNVAEEEINEHKIKDDDSDSINLYTLYNEKFSKFVKYNINDVRLMVGIENKTKIFDLAIAVRNYTKVNFQEIFHETITIDNLFLMEAVRRRKYNNWEYILPSKDKNAIKKKFTGGYVKPPITGLFKWLGDLDYTSLYPSITKTFKISIETLVGKISNHQIVELYNIANYYNNNNLKYIKDELFPVYYVPDLKVNNEINKNVDNIQEEFNNLGIDIEYSILYSDLNFPKHFNTLSEFIKFLEINNYALLPNGTVFDQSKENAIIPAVIADVMNSRNQYKNKMKDYLKSYDKTKSDKDKAQADIFNMYQKAVKVINNACYGTTANERFRLFNLDVAESITTSGQVIIRNTRYIANNCLNKLANTKDIDYVITIDTDSIICTYDKLVPYDVKESDPDKLKEISNFPIMVQKEINKNIVNIVKNLFYKTNVNEKNNFLNIKNEWLANAGLFIAKKNYVIRQVFKEGIPYEKISATGISLRRSSTPKILKPFLENVLTKILSFSEKNEIDKLIIDECYKIKNVYNISDIALPISLSDKQYENTPIHLRGAKIWNDYYAQSEINKITIGKIKYIYVSSWDIQQLNIDKEYVISIPDSKNDWDYISNRINIDYNKMKERLVIKPVNALYKAIKWDMPIEINTNNNGAFLNIINNNKSNKMKLI